MNDSVLVIGAGVVGLSVARCLARATAAVTVADSSPDGGLGSRAAAGVTTPPLRARADDALWRFLQQGRDCLARDLAELAASEPGLHRPCEIVRYAANEAQREALAQSYHETDLGAWMGREELAEREPALAEAAIVGGFHQPGAMLVDASRYVSALADSAMRAGATLRLGCQVSEVTASAGGVTARLDGRRIAVDRVVVAAGAWSGTIGGLPAIPVSPIRGQIVTLRRPGLRLSAIMSGRTYLAPWPGGQVRVGATEESAGFNSHATALGASYLCQRAIKLIPSLAEAAVTGLWAGLRAGTHSGRPLIGTLPGMPRVVVATGHNGFGILTGALTGQMVEALMSRRETCETEFAP